MQRNYLLHQVHDFLFICNFPAGEIRQLKKFSTELDQPQTSEREISQLTEKLETVTAERDKLKSKFDTHCRSDVYNHCLTVMLMIRCACVWGG